MTFQQTVVPQTRRTSWALVVLCATQLMVILDGTIVNVALPTIRATSTPPAASSPAQRP